MTDYYRDFDENDNLQVRSERQVHIDGQRHQPCFLASGSCFAVGVPGARSIYVCFPSNISNMINQCKQMPFIVIEILQSVNSNIAKDTYAFWVRSGNVNRGNVAIGRGQWDPVGNGYRTPPLVGLYVVSFRRCRGHKQPAWEIQLNSLLL